MKRATSALLAFAQILLLSSCASTPPLPLIKQQGYPCGGELAAPFSFQSKRCYWSDEKQACDCKVTKEKVTTAKVAGEVILGIFGTAALVAMEIARARWQNSGRGPID